MWTFALAAAALAAPVTFQVNDAIVKDQAVEAVVVHGTTSPDAAPEPLGTTDASGHLAVDLAPGTWRVAYVRSGYVPIPPAATTILPEGAAITTAMTPLLESTGDAGHRRVQIVLNWGSLWAQVPDADAHLVCSDGAEVYFGAKTHVGGDSHEARLDVDDVSWGGPETITLIDAPPGRYTYFVRNYSGAGYALGTSDVVVRVVLDDAVAGEFRAPADVVEKDWYPFAALVVESDGRTRVEPFTPEALAARANRHTTGTFEGGLSLMNVVLGAVACTIVGALGPLAMSLLRRFR